MELAQVKCGRGHWHRVWFDNHEVYVSVAGGRRHCGTASNALRATQVALSFLGALCG